MNALVIALIFSWLPMPLGAFELTAYCPCERCCGRWADGMTATGQPAYEPGVAVDPTRITLGSTVYIQDVGWCVADDVGGAIKGMRIDVRFQSHNQALRFGRRKGVLVWTQQKK